LRRASPTPPPSPSRPLLAAQLSGSVQALACKGDLTFAAVGSNIEECKRVHKCVDLRVAWGLRGSRPASRPSSRSAGVRCRSSAWQPTPALRLRVCLRPSMLTLNPAALECVGTRAITSPPYQALAVAADRGGLPPALFLSHRSGQYWGHHTGAILSLMVLGDLLLSLGADGKLVVWRIGKYDTPEVRQQQQ
jgi:hypothetical protein